MAKINKEDLKIGVQFPPCKECDRVEVVRCGECEHFKEYPIVGTSNPSGWGKCTKINMDVDLTINDYCSYGERRCEE